MSAGKDIQVEYYSSLLARAVKESDGDKFTDFYDRIIDDHTEKYAEKVKERAYELCDASDIILNRKIEFYETQGVLPIPVKRTNLTKNLDSESSKDLPDNSKNLELVQTEQSSGDQVGITTSPYTGDKERSLVEIFSKNSMEKPQKNPFEDRVTSYIDGVDDDLTTPLINDQLENIPTDTEKENLDSVNNNLGYISIKIPEEVDSSIDFNLQEKSSSNSFNNYFQPNDKDNMFEMTEIKRDSTWNKNLSNEESGDDVDNKKNKKRKKRKSKGIVTTDNQDPKEIEIPENVDEKSAKSSRNIRRKKLKEESRKTSVPPIENDTNNNIKPIEKKKKRTVKQFKEEQAKKNSEKIDEMKRFAPMKSFGYGTMNINEPSTSKSYKKKPEKPYQPAEYLDDETVKKILRNLGDETETMEIKKKVVKEKVVPNKKDKKKNKKSKKVVDEGRKMETNENETKNENLSKVNPVDNSMEFIFNEENDEDFVTQQRRSRRVINNKTQLLSGRTSPTNTATRKRRFSDPSPSINKNPGSKVEPTTSFETHNVYDGQDWPLLTTGLAGSSGQNTSLSRASYASKLKSNLDSTGCSLASSSEDSGSSSSSSSNFPSCGGVSATESDINSVAQFLSVATGAVSVVEATADMLKCLTQEKEEKSENEKVKKSKKENKGQDNKVSGSNKTEGPSSKNQEPKTDNSKANETEKVLENETNVKPKVADKETNPEDKPATKPQGKTDKAPNSSNNPEKMDEIFKNKWGLDFFMTEEQSHLAPEFNFNLDMLDKGDFELTFGDNAPIEIPQPAAIVDVMNINAEPSQWNDPGDFNLGMAAKFLNKEWQTALNKGKFYE